MRLSNAYGANAEIFSLAMKGLLAKMGTSSRPEYEEMRSETELARMNMERARWNLERHILEHRC